MPDTPTPPTPIAERYHYEPEYIADILNSVKTVAIVGASANKAKPVYDVLCRLRDLGYEILPVNPNPQLTEIDGLKTYHSLQDIKCPVDMVEVFRPKEELYGIAEQALKIGTKVLWGQLDIYDERAAELFANAGLKTVMDRCPLIEMAKPAVKSLLSAKI